MLCSPWHFEPRLEASGIGTKDTCREQHLRTCPWCARSLQLDFEDDDDLDEDSDELSSDED